MHISTTVRAALYLACASITPTPPQKHPARRLPSLVTISALAVSTGQLLRTSHKHWEVFNLDPVVLGAAPDRKLLDPQSVAADNHSAQELNKAVITPGLCKLLALARTHFTKAQDALLTDSQDIPLTNSQNALLTNSLCDLLDKPDLWRTNVESVFTDHTPTTQVILIFAHVLDQSSRSASTPVSPSDVQYEPNCTASAINLITPGMARELNKIFQRLEGFQPILANIGPELTEAGIYVATPPAENTPDPTYKNPAWGINDPGIFLDTSGHVNPQDKRQCPTDAKTCEINLLARQLDLFGHNLNTLYEQATKTKDPADFTTLMIEVRKATALLALLDVLFDGVTCEIPVNAHALFHAQTTMLDNLDSVNPFPGTLQAILQPGMGDERELTQFGMIFARAVPIGSEAVLSKAGSSTSPARLAECKTYSYPTLHTVKQIHTHLRSSDFSCIPAPEQAAILDAGVAWMDAAWFLMGAELNKRLDEYTAGWSDIMHAENPVVQMVANYLAAGQSLLSLGLSPNRKPLSGPFTQRNELYVTLTALEELLKHVDTILPKLFSSTESSPMHTLIQALKDGYGLTAIFDKPNSQAPTERLKIKISTDGAVVFDNSSLVHSY